MTAPLSNDDFFVKLSELFDASRKKDHGSVYLTQKRLAYPAPSSDSTPSTSAPFPDLAPTQPQPLLIRASNGKHKLKAEKLSTVVAADALDVFFARYAEVCKAGMSGLKKRDRSKAKAKQKAKKKAAPAAAAGEEKK